MNLQQILDQSPDIPAYGGGKWAMYSFGCCWWTSFPEDLGTTKDFPLPCIPRDGYELPCCPHCGSVLLQAPLASFIEAARASPNYYGRHGLVAFAAGHSRNADYCHDGWRPYNLRLDSIQERQNGS